MTEEAHYPELPETLEPRGIAKTSSEVTAELYRAPRANHKGRAISADATRLVSFLDETYPRPSSAGAHKGPYRAGDKFADRRRQAIASWLAELLISTVVEDGGGWLAVSLNKANFNEPSPVSWRTFGGIRKPWIAAGLLEENKGFPGILAFDNPGPLVGRLSRFRATPRLLEICESNGITVDNADEHFAVEFDMPSELVRITSPPMPTRNTPHVQRMRDEVADLNAFFGKHKLEGARHSGWVRMFHEATGRDFNFDRGGRLYSQPGIPKSNYQHMPRESRIALKIDGESLSEIDISGSYLTIFHAAHGRAVDVAGAYEGILGPEGIDRAIVKAWVNASFGNRGLIGQWSARLKKDFAKKHRNEGWEIDPKKYPVKRVRAAVLARHPLLASWGQQAPRIPSSYGDLMFLESRVIISTMVRLATEHFIPSAPVHDSLLVPRSKVGVARRLLQEQFKDALGVTPLLKVYPSLT
ncbi:hypothetical protein JQ597_06020 [Bradyrhizobium sp. AUGA SZCCT0177]|uniref:hypothetical protein n=1 Tax=Bradyrhizobium sp. AUGA SZCCT0177 TaxID=2807665 RepID=UPI001BA6088C|nr:hypothetical protein [Bradyrhizobium sp. AUGA SZCCT0177]MBR1281588.1 hypothetical protein [Bradyrhizobium sp. AUGA SZCCT0177]